MFCQRIFTYHRKHNFREFLSRWNFQFLGEWSGFLFAFIFKHISTYLFSFEKYLFYLTNCVDIENIILQTKISAPVLKFSSKVSFSQQRKWIQRIFLSCLKCRKFDNKKKKVQCTAHFVLAYATGNTEPTINDIGKKKKKEKKENVFNIVHVLCHKCI